MAKPKKIPPIARKFLDVYGELWQCSDEIDRELQEWAKTRTETNCYAGEYLVAQFILNGRKKVRGGRLT